MATESVTKYVMDAEDVKRIQWMLLDAIQLKDQLDLLKHNIQTGAKEGYSAKNLQCLVQGPVDLDIAEAAGMIQILSVLSAGREA